MVPPRRDLRPDSRPPPVEGASEEAPRALRPAAKSGSMWPRPWASSHVIATADTAVATTIPPGQTSRSNSARWSNRCRWPATLRRSATCIPATPRWCSAPARSVSVCGSRSPGLGLDDVYVVEPSATCRVAIAVLEARSLDPTAVDVPEFIADLVLPVDISCLLPHSTAPTIAARAVTSAEYDRHGRRGIGDPLRWRSC